MTIGRDNPETWPRTWYAATCDPSADRPPLAGKIECDVAVVGGGFAGLHTARLLALRGRKVALVERHRVGWGASGRNGGFVSPGYAARVDVLLDKLGPDKTRELYRLSQEGVAIVRDAIRDLGRPDIVMGKGKLTVSRVDKGPGHYPDLARRLSRELGATVFAWNTGEVRALLRTERYFQALFNPESFHIHPLNLVLALAADIERRGGTIHESTAAVELKRTGEVWRLRTDAGEIVARHVVLAGSAHLGRVRRRVAAAVLPVATFIAVTAKLGPRLAEAVRWPGAISDTRRAGNYYRVVDGDRLLWGGAITTDTRERANLRRDMQRDIASVYPQLGEVAIDYAWPGIMGYALHKMPQVGEIERGLWICTAFGGHGVAQTAAAASVIASGITGEDERWRMFSPFGLDWAGGPFGRVGVQLTYWGMQARDWVEERMAPRS
jgi:glycine/D-amino acid oxidase-like deaminating enzyme